MVTDGSLDPLDETVDVCAQVGTLPITKTINGKSMSIFNEEDTQIIRSLALTFAGFIALTAGLIVLAIILT